MIENLLPHSKNMVLVDEILSCDGAKISTKSKIKESPFLKNGKFPSYQLIEIMAQTLGIYRSQNSKNGAQNLAFLVGSRKFEIFKNELEINDEIITKAALSIQDENGFGVWDCECFLNEKLIARAILSVLNPSAEKINELKNG